MQKYLAGGGDELNRSVGEVYAADFDFSRYEATVTVQHLTTNDPTKAGQERKLSLELRPLGKVTMDSPSTPDAATDAPKTLKLSFNNTKLPGAYLFTLTRKKQEGLTTPGGTPDPLGDLDFVGAAFNVDALNEGDLRRANTDDIAANTHKAPLLTSDEITKLTETLKQKPADYSSRRWLYLLILLVLLAEQAWAVRTSYHSKPEDLETLAPSAAAAYAHHTMPTPASSGEPAEEAAVAPK
jgi:methionine-rich copper-binding protein CopC